MTAVRAIAMAGIVVQFLWPAAGYCGEAASDAVLKDEMSKQQAIYQGRGAQQLEGYIIDRSLLAYSFVLSKAFDTALAKLGPNDRWLDIGAGQGRAVADYYSERYDSMHPEGREQRGTKASSVAMSIEDRRTDEWHKAAAGLEPGKMQYVTGKPLRDYSAAELGRFQLVTDVIGGFSYTSDLSRFVGRVLEILTTGGDFFTILQDVHSQDEDNKPYYAGSPYLTEITGADGSELKVCGWLRSITCVQVTCEIRSDWAPPVEVYRVHKTCDDVRVPALTRVHYQAGTPPERGFRLEKAPAAPGDTAR